MADANTVAAAIQAVINLFGSNSQDSGPSKTEFLAGMTVLNGQIDDIHSSILRVLDQSILATINTGSNVHNAVAQNIYDQTNVLVPIINSGVSAILSAINNGQQGIDSQDIQAVNQILNQILNNTQSTLNGQDALIGNILFPIQSSVANLDNDVFGLTNLVDNNFTGVFSVLGEILTGINQQGQQVINNQIIIDDSIYGSVLGSVGSIIDGTLGDLISIVDVISGSYENTIDELLGVLIATGQTDTDDMRRIADVLESLKDPTLDNLGRMGTGSGDGFGALFGEGFLGKWGESLNAMGPGFERMVRSALTGEHRHETGVDCGIFDFWDGVVDDTVPNGLFELLKWVITVLVIPLNASQVQANIEMQRYRRCFPDMLLQPGDLMHALNWNEIDLDKAITDIEKQGYTHDDAELLAKTRFQTPDITLLYELRLRGLMTENELYQGLLRRGYEPTDALKLLELKFFIPPVQDLITMAVREVFTPEIARANGQFDEFPQAFAEWAAKQGVNEEWAKNYWAAHWRLPSEQMGFEMFHRQIIDEKRLRGLMVALDIMPGWRDEIIEISYNPLTRVDVRRMHQLGVLDRAQVLKAYRDIGYSPENAELMTQFTELYNEGDDPNVLFEVEDLSRTAVLKFFKRGIIKRGEALAYLLAGGLSVFVAEMYMDTAELELHLEEREKTVDIIIAEYRTGEITFDQASDRISALELESPELRDAQLQLLKTKEVVTKIPSRSDLDKFADAGFIDRAEYIDTMRLNGYSEKWAAMYYELAMGGENGTNDENGTTLEIAGDGNAAQEGARTGPANPNR